MAGSKGDYLEDALLDHVLGGPDFDRPATVYVHLYTAAPSDSGGTEVDTDDWTNYAAEPVLNNDTNFPAALDGLKSNGVAIDFGVAAIAAPVHVEGFALQDSSGNLLYWGDLTTHKDISDGDPVEIPIGGLVITED